MCVCAFGEGCSPGSAQLLIPFFPFLSCRPTSYNTWETCFFLLECLRTRLLFFHKDFSHQSRTFCRFLVSILFLPSEALDSITRLPPPLRDYVKAKLMDKMSKRREVRGFWTRQETRQPHEKFMTSSLACPTRYFPPLGLCCPPYTDLGTTDKPTEQPLKTTFR